MSVFVTAAQAVDHLRILASDATTDDLQTKLDEAEAIILKEINKSLYWRTITPTWTADTVPKEVPAAIKLTLGDLWVDRDGYSLPDQRPRDPHYGLLPVVVALLAGYLDPVI